MASKPLAAAVLTALLALPAGAHHDFSEEYDENALTRISGQILSIQLGNPHSSIQLEVQREGLREVWTLHGDNPAQLAATGLTRQTLRPADKVTACGYLPKPPKDEEVDPSLPRPRPTTLFAEQLLLSDGRKINFASNGPGKCLDPIIPDVVSRYTRVPGTNIVTESLPIVPMNTGPSQPVADAPALEAGRTADAPVLEAPADVRSRPPVPPSVPTIAVQQRIPYDPLESGYLELYDRQKPVSLTGKVTRVDWAQPNTYIFMTVNNAPWVVEASYIQFRQISVSPAIHEGDVITVEGFLPREKPIQPLPASYHAGASALMRAERLVRAGQIVISGFVLNMGIPPTDEEIARRSWCAGVRC